MNAFFSFDLLMVVDISLLSRPLSFCFHINTVYQGKGGNIETVLIFLPEKVDKICFSK
jgi:hypothetical protein